MNKAVVAKIKKKQQENAQILANKNAGVKGNEVKKLKDAHKKIKHIASNLDNEQRDQFEKQNKYQKKKKALKTKTKTLEQIDIDKRVLEQEKENENVLFVPFEDNESNIIQSKGIWWPDDDHKSNKVQGFLFMYKMWMLFHCTLILCFCVARIAFEKKPWVYVIYTEFWLDFVFLIDMIRIFFTPVLDQFDKRIYSRKLIVQNYMLGWFWSDCFGFFPLAYVRFHSVWSEGSLNDIQNLLDLNFQRLPRLYQVMLLMQMPRARFAEEYLVILFKKLDFRQEYQDLSITFIKLSFTLHVAGCLWFSSSSFNRSSDVNWVSSRGIQDDGILVKYATSLYWATVTCTTVGYGDILPTNGWELIWAMFIIVFGVAQFSFILGNLSSQFSSIANNDSSNEEKLNEIDQLDEKFNIGYELVQQITDYFEESNDEGFETNNQMAYLLKILPITIKTKLAKFLYSDAIFINRFLQNRDDDFYAKYLEELQSDKIPKGSYIAKAGSKPDAVYFIMNGVIFNETTQRFFESGQIINHDIVLENSHVVCDYVAHTDVGVLKYSIDTFQQIIQQFPEIEEDLKEVLAQKKDYNTNNKFLKKSIKNDKVKKTIIANYYDIIDEENKNTKKANRSLAIKMNQQARQELEIREPNVMFRSKKERARRSVKQNLQQRKLSLSPNKSNSSPKKQKQPQSDDQHDQSSMDDSNAENNDKETPGNGSENEQDEKIITKVQDLLKEQNKSALNINVADLEQMFNMQMPKLATYQGGPDSVSEEIFKNIRQQRLVQKKLLPLYLESQRVIQRHQKCLETVLDENEHDMPKQLSGLMDQGQEGLVSYGRLMQSIKKIMHKNNILFEQLNQYQINMKKLKNQSSITQDNVHSMTAEYTEAAVTFERIEKSKDRIEDLLSGMFQNIDGQN